MTDTGHRDFLRWIGGIISVCLVGALSFTISLNLSNESRITALETKLFITHESLQLLWTKYDDGQKTKGKLVERLIIIEQKQNALEKHLNELKRR